MSAHKENRPGGKEKAEIQKSITAAKDKMIFWAQLLRKLHFASYLRCNMLSKASKTNETA